MSQIIKNPLTPKQIEQSKTVSEQKVREAQDALFMFLIGRIEELEAKLNPTKKVRKT